jgi:hypothetical protein
LDGAGIVLDQGWAVLPRKNPAGSAAGLLDCQMPPSSIKTMIRLNGTPSNQSKIGMSFSFFW